MTASLISAFPAKEIALSNLNLLFPNGAFPNYIHQYIPLGLSYITMLMLMMPCSATIATMKKEGS